MVQVRCTKFHVSGISLSRAITAQIMKFSIKDFFSKCDQIRRILRIWLHLLKKSLMENFIFCAVIQLLRTFSEIWVEESLW